MLPVFVTCRKTGIADRFVAETGGVVFALAAGLAVAVICA